MREGSDSSCNGRMAVTILVWCVCVCFLLVLPLFAHTHTAHTRAHTDTQSLQTMPQKAINTRRSETHKDRVPKTQMKDKRERTLRSQTHTLAQQARPHICVRLSISLLPLAPSPNPKQLKDDTHLFIHAKARDFLLIPTTNITHAQISHTQRPQGLDLRRGVDLHQPPRSPFPNFSIVICSDFPHHTKFPILSYSYPHTIHTHTAHSSTHTNVTRCLR